MKTCEYCHNESDQVQCPGCSAPLNVAKKKPTEIRSVPFFYDGYMVFRGEDFASDILKYYFYLGENLVEIIEISRQFLYSLKDYQEGVDVWPFIWDLFKLAQGETEVLRIKELNDRNPAVFEIRRIEQESLTADQALVAWQEGSVG